MNFVYVRDSEALVRNAPDRGARRYNMDRTFTAVLVATIMAMSCCVLLVSDDGDAADATYVAEVSGSQYGTLAEAYNAATSGSTINLLSDVKLTERFDISKSITLNLGGHTISADKSFTRDSSDNNRNQLINVKETDNSSDINVKITNGTLKSGINNYHTLNIYKVSNVELKNMVIDHSESYYGAPLIINGSKVTLGGSMTFVTGNNSWYAVNVDNKEGGTSGASLTTAANAELVFKGTSPLAIYVETTQKDKGGVDLTFGDGTKAVSDIEDFILRAVSPEANTDLVKDNASEVDIIPETESAPEPTPTPGYDDDENLPPYIPSQSSNDDDTVTIVACAAAAAVAAILAVFLVIDRK